MDTLTVELIQSYQSYVVISKALFFNPVAIKPLLHLYVYTSYLKIMGFTSLLTKNVIPATVIFFHIAECFRKKLIMFLHRVFIQK